MKERDCRRRRQRPDFRSLPDLILSRTGEGPTEKPHPGPRETRKARKKTGISDFSSVQAVRPGAGRGGPYRHRPRDGRGSQGSGESGDSADCAVITGYLASLTVSEEGFSMSTKRISAILTVLSLFLFMGLAAPKVQATTYSFTTLDVPGATRTEAASITRAARWRALTRMARVPMVSYIAAVRLRSSMPRVPLTLGPLASM